jgi:aldehyde:ferredoxin oxidoreductase
MVTLVEWTAILSALAGISAAVFLIIELRHMDKHKDLEISMKLFEWAETDRLRKAFRWVEKDFQFENFKFNFYNAVTGLSLTRKKWAIGGGLRTLQIQRALLLLGGPDLTWNPEFDDDNPSRFYEPLPSGPCKGKAANKANVREKVHEYYEQAGWDEKGIPKSEILNELRLGDVDSALKKLRGKSEGT